MGDDRGVELQQVSSNEGRYSKKCDADSEERERAGELRHSIAHIMLTQRKKRLGISNQSFSIKFL